MEEFYRNVYFYLSSQATDFSGGKVSEINEFIGRVKEARQFISRSLPRARRLADTFEIPVVARNQNTGIDYHAFSAILNTDAGIFISDADKLDLINQTLGACIEQERSEFLCMINPFYWLTKVVAGVLRIPFWILTTAGFKTESFEASLAGSVVRLIELLAIIYVLFSLGFRDSELREVVIGIFKNA